MDEKKRAPLQAILTRLSEMLIRAERRCMRYNTEGISRDIDIAFVEHLAVSLYQLQKYQHLVQSSRPKTVDDRDNDAAYIKDAILQLHELSTFIDKHKAKIESPFMRRFVEKEDRWLRMNMISLVGFMVHTCTDNIRHSLKNLQRNLSKMNVGTNIEERGTQYGHLRLINCE